MHPFSLPVPGPAGIRRALGGPAPFSREGTSLAAPAAGPPAASRSDLTRREPRWNAPWRTRSTLARPRRPPARSRARPPPRRTSCLPWVSPPPVSGAPRGEGLPGSACGGGRVSTARAGLWGRPVPRQWSRPATTVQLDVLELAPGGAGPLDGRRAAAAAAAACPARLAASGGPKPRLPARRGGVLLPRTAEAEALMLEWGRNELEEKSTPKWLVFLKMVRRRPPPPRTPAGSASPRPRAGTPSQPRLCGSPQCRRPAPRRASLPPPTLPC